MNKIVEGYAKQKKNKTKMDNEKKMGSNTKRNRRKDEQQQ